MQILMPMAGLGSRFNLEGTKKILKPLIEFEGQPLFQKALNSVLPSFPQANLIFVIKRSDAIEFGFEDKLKKSYPQSSVCVLEQMTRGALETCFLAKESLDEAKPLLLLDSDLSFSSPSFLSYLRSPQEGEGGALLSFSSEDTRYSYARVEGDFVLETAEKKVISPHALVGAYFFTKASYFLNEAEARLFSHEKIKEEKPFYIAPLYNELLKKNLKIRFFEIESYQSYGTPEELNLARKT